jgi:S-adenosylmethionine:tRNA ribosyltransferase-isomerase
MTAVALAEPATRFRRAPGSDATRPPEARGVARDAVRLLVADPAGITHTRFDRIGRHLRPGDLLVVNDSATLAAAVDARWSGSDVVVHFSTELDDGSWVVEVRPAGVATGPLPGVTAGQVLQPPAGGLRLVDSHPTPGRIESRLWRARVRVEGGVAAYLALHGRPIRYAYVPEAWPLSSYQTVFARRPGSAEMPSAARPFTAELVTSLVSAGIVVAPVTLHAGVSSGGPGEPPAAERFEVPEPTARLVELARAAGNRVVAVGTTVVRALESAVDDDGRVRPARGWTDLVLGPDRPARAVTGLVTGWHDAGTSHLLLLEAVAGAPVVGRAYDAATCEGYLWHEFGDSALLLPSSPGADSSRVQPTL